MFILGWGVDQWSPGEGCIKTLQGLPVTMLILGCQSMVTLGRICKDFARITCDNVDPGRGLINVTLGKIPEDFARITCDHVDPGGAGQLMSPWTGSVKTLQRLPVPMLILVGGFN